MMAPQPGQHQVYPRVCGGSVAGFGGRHIAEGLSPRVRGKRDELLPPAGVERSIPACAGEAKPKGAAA